MFGLAMWLRLGAGAAVVVGLVLVGDFYGHNAHWRAHREAEDAARNGALEYQSEHETAAGKVEDATHAAEDKHFVLLSKGVDPCLLSEDQAAVLNIVGE